jgi:hypothetical protein
MFEPNNVNIPYPIFVKSKKIARNKQEISKKCRGWDLNPNASGEVTHTKTLFLF